jgi:hypothetical protein
MTEQLYEAWFKCGCTKIAPLREIIEYCAVHGEDREGLALFSPSEPEDSGTAAAQKQKM